MDLLSVIIPVYKVENYLRECVDSVLAQTYTTLEVILVDDGSPDSCPDICDDYARRDARVKVIHQPNRGLSAARNAGIEAAQGDFIAFVDSDDYISPTYFEAAMELFAEVPDLDMVELPLLSRFNTQKATRHVPQTTAIIKGHENVFTEWFARQGFLRAYAQLKVSRRRLFQSLRFPIGKTFEDLHIVPKLLMQCNTIAFAAHPTANYFYRWRDESITAQARWADLDSQTSAMQEIAIIADGCGNISPYDWAQFVMAASNLLIDNQKAARREKLSADFKAYSALLSIIQKHKPSIAIALNIHQDWRTTLKASLLACLNIKTYIHLFA